MACPPTRHSAVAYSKKITLLGNRWQNVALIFLLMGDYASQVLEGENDEHENRWGIVENLWSSAFCVVESKMKHLTLYHCAFHVQIQHHALTGHSGSGADWFGSYLWSLSSHLMSLIMFCPSSQDWSIRTEMKEGKEVDIHFSRLKWFSLKI